MKQINPLTIGTQVPNTELLNQDQQPVKLSDYLGQKVLLYFYPKAMTPGCTTQACGLRDSMAQYHAANIKVLGVSPDPATRLARFIEKEGLNFDLLADPDNELANAFGVWGEKKFMGKTYEGIHRMSFLIDEQGKVLHCITKVKTKSHHQDVLDLFSSLTR